MGFAEKLGRLRSMTYDNGKYSVAGTETKPHINLELYFDFNSAAITPRAEGQLRELGEALSDPKLKDSTISVNGFTDAVGSDAFNKRLSERRAVAIKGYLVETFNLPASGLKTVGYGKARLKNSADPNAAENRRVEVVNLASQAQAKLN
jgi:outer membrane protein OmpA-like peptidoglycan-associated protein